LAGANVTADATSAPAVLESLDVWPWLSGVTATSPRTEIVYDHRMESTDPSYNTSHLPGNASGALRVGKWKLVVGATNQASWYGHFSPNKSACGHVGAEGGACPSEAYTACTDAPCLFDMETDKTEHFDVAASEPDTLTALLSRWSEISAEYHPPPNPELEEAAYCANIEKNMGFVAPWQ
jgi:hypothetical protein